MGVTPKQEVFCQAIAKGKSQRQAYYEAYPNSKKWKPCNVDSRASALANTDKVITRLKELRGEEEDEVQRVRKGLIEELDNIAKTNIGDFYRTVEDDEGKTHLVLKDFDEVDFRAVKKISFSRNGEPIVELYDKVGAINKLSDMYGLNDAKVDASVTISVDDSFKEMCD